MAATAHETRMGTAVVHAQEGGRSVGATGRRIGTCPSPISLLSYTCAHTAPASVRRPSPRDIVGERQRIQNGQPEQSYAGREPKQPCTAPKMHKDEQDQSNFRSGNRKVGGEVAPAEIEFRTARGGGKEDEQENPA